MRTSTALIALILVVMLSPVISKMEMQLADMLLDLIAKIQYEVNKLENLIETHTHYSAPIAATPIHNTTSFGLPPTSTQTQRELPVHRDNVIVAKLQDIIYLDEKTIIHVQGVSTPVSCLRYAGGWWTIDPRFAFVVVFMEVGKLDAREPPSLLPVKRIELKACGGRIFEPHDPRDKAVQAAFGLEKHFYKAEPMCIEYGIPDGIVVDNKKLDKLRMRLVELSPVFIVPHDCDSLEELRIYTRDGRIVIVELDMRIPPDYWEKISG